MQLWERDKEDATDSWTLENTLQNNKYEGGQAWNDSGIKIGNTPPTDLSSIKWVTSTDPPGRGVITFTKGMTAYMTTVGALKTACGTQT